MSCCLWDCRPVTALLSLAHLRGGIRAEEGNTAMDTEKKTQPVIGRRALLKGAAGLAVAWDGSGGPARGAAAADHAGRQHAAGHPVRHRVVHRRGADTERRRRERHRAAAAGALGVRHRAAEPDPDHGGPDEPENALNTLEATYPFAAAGILTFISYGIPYFNRLPGGMTGSLVSSHMPRLASNTSRFALEEAVPGPTDVSRPIPG